MILNYHGAMEILIYVHFTGDVLSVLIFSELIEIELLDVIPGDYGVRFKELPLNVVIVIIMKV